jgi:hemoglobin
MDRLPEAKKIRDLHAKSLKVSRKKLFMFLSGWLVGAQVYLSSMVIRAS